MIRGYFTILYIILTIVLVACKGQPIGPEQTSGSEETRVFTFKDSCKHLVFHLSLELPMGEDSATICMRDSLIVEFMRGADQPGYEEEGQKAANPFKGDKSDFAALVEHYGKAGYKSLLKLAMEDYTERMTYLEEDTTFTEEDRQRIKADVPQWAFDYTVKRLTDAAAFQVYTSEAYVYLGGAHGGVVGAGALTFDKQTGRKIERFVNPAATTAMQKLLRKGLLKYYSEVEESITDEQLSERLQIEGTIIPLPQRAACPNATGDSLIFTYGQYEIACYADGMPTFMLPVKELLPFLTPEGRAVLSKASAQCSKR